MRPISREIELLENLSGRSEQNGPTLLSHSKRRYPEGYEPVLPEWEAVLRMCDDFELEPTVPTDVMQSSGWRAANGQATEDERAGVEYQHLPLLVSFFSDEFDRLDSPALAFGSD
ncbi:MAG TPA: hypothetical protein VEX68_26450 [Bryobacteraceae bacterium]|nr:hypothetical protein [Bryobacteraceae bacterium]